MSRLLLAVAFVLSPPVPGPVTRPYDPPEARWGPGHRGVDFGVPPGTPVRAAADGLVSFAGDVAGGLSVTVEHPGTLQTTYSFLARVEVVAGRRVAAGDRLGVSGGTGPGHGPDVVHFGVRRAGHYVDPMSMLGLLLRVRLAPADGDLVPPVCPGPPEGTGDGAAMLNGRPGLPAGYFTRPHPNGDRSPTDSASSGRRPNRGTKEKVAWPSSR